MTDIRIGISGWNYAPWRGTFFPPKLVQREELEYAYHMIRSIEINGTFYSLQRPESYGRWHDQTPEDFVFSVKAPRFITHIKRLKNIHAPLANFFASGVLRLGKKLGPILWQLPPSFHYNADQLADFFARLPRDTHAAAALAREHDDAVKQTWLEPGIQQKLRHALEVRHESFKQPEFIALLRKHRVALVVADTAGKWPFMEDVTSDFVYIRLHGDAELYVSGYTDSALEEWARKIRVWHEGGNPSGAKLSAEPSSRAAGREVFAYFDNDVKTHAPFDAMTLAHKLGLAPVPPPRFTAPTPRAIAAATPRGRWPGVGGGKKARAVKARRPSK